MNLSAVRVLLVNADPMMPETLSVLLTGDDLSLTHATNTEEALRILQDQHPDLILLDIGQTGANGLECLSQIKSSPAGSQLPVLLLSADSDVAGKVRAFELGTVDYLIKPVEGAELRARVCAV